MFNGVMDPELMRMAQEQMSRMSPADFARIQQQMMANPELMKMASESMQNMRPEDLRAAAEQMKHTRPEEIADISEKMTNATPEELATMRVRADAQCTYQINAAQVLKNQGNELHSQGRFSDAAKKYTLAKKNLKDIPSAKGRSLSLACSLNLMSCYLKTKQFDHCIEEGFEVLSYDAKNVKALYRRGQALKELGRIEDAIADLTKAHEVSPDDETIANVLRDTQEKYASEGSHRKPKGLVIEEITEEDQPVSSGEDHGSSPDHLMFRQEEMADTLKDGNGVRHQVMADNTENLQALKDDPEAIRSFQNFISKADPETMAAMSGAKAGEIPPDMFKTASKMISKMSSDEIQKMVQLATSFQGDKPYSTSGSVENGFKPTPDMVKLASDMMNKMSPDERQQMFEMASSMKANASVPASSSAGNDRKGLGDDAEHRGLAEKPTVTGTSFAGEASSSSNFFINPRNAPQFDFPSSSADLREQMQNQMRNPAMRQMFTSMVKNMSPEMMASMSEQYGFKLSQEEAAKAHQAMSSLSPETLDKMMLWADRMQRGTERARKAKDWLLGRGGLILAICMLILAMVLHRLGYIGA